MPIKIPDDLPAGRTLQEEGVVIIAEHDAIRQDIRPLRIAMLNLMPEKIKTETQLARLIGATPLQIEFTLLTTVTYTPPHTSREHMTAFYRPWKQVRNEKFDGLIVTGAPVEEMDFEQVKYWPELCEIFDWAAGNVFSTFNICWGAQAALYHRHRVPKYLLPRKLALLATEGNKKQIERERAKFEAKEAEEQKVAQAIADRLSTIEIVIARKVGETDALYGSVTASDITEALAAKGCQIIGG